MPAPDWLRAQLLEQLHEVLIPGYLEHGCPCAFPRFRHLAGFFHRDLDAGPVGCFETELIVEELFRQERACYRAEPSPGEQPAPRHYTCTVCGSRYVEDLDQYNIHFYRSFVKAVDDRATPVGADVVTPFPLVLGLFWFQQADADVCYRHFEQASLEAFVAYMKALAAA